MGCSRGSIAAFDQLTRAGLVTSGSVMVPSLLFGEAAALVERRPDLDVGVHLTLTSESTAVRWRPLTGAFDLRDADGFLWHSVAEARRNASVESVEGELRAQIQRALDSGIRITHLDHHMGVSAAPEFVEVAVSLAVEYGIPMLLPTGVAGYYDVLKVGDADPTPAQRARSQLESAGLLVADDFAIGYLHQSEDCRAVYERLISSVGDGITYLSLHCSAPGDIEVVHPRSAAWRIAEYELFGDPEFVVWVEQAGVEITPVRAVGG